MRKMTIVVAILGCAISILALIWFDFFFFTGWMQDGQLSSVAISIVLLTLFFVNLWLVDHRQDETVSPAVRHALVTLSIAGTLAILGLVLWPLVIIE